MLEYDKIEIPSIVRFLEFCFEFFVGMKLGISTYSCPWSIGVNGFLPRHQLSADELIEFASANNIHYVQFGDNYQLHNSKQKMQALKTKAAESNINIQVGTRRLQYDHILEYIEIAHEFQSPFLRIVIDDAGFHPTKEEVIKTIKKLLPIFEKKKMILAIENHDRFKAEILKQIILETSPEYVGICLDTCNSLGAGEGINEILTALLPYTVNLHIKDFKIERVDHKMGFNMYGTPAGTGMLDIPLILQAFTKSKKCETATLEIWMNPLPTIEETVQQEAKWVEQSIQYLKKFIP